eukprot:Gb_03151 [translate_table: standard]
MVPQEHWPGNCANIQLKGEELRARENRLSQPSVCRSFCCWEEILQVQTMEAIFVVIIFTALTIILSVFLLVFGCPRFNIVCERLTCSTRLKALVGRIWSGKTENTQVDKTDEAQEELTDKAQVDKEPRRVDGKWYKLNNNCLLAFQRGDITRWSVDGKTDAIVNAANQSLLGGGGVDGAIHRAAGLELLEACSCIPEVTPGVRCPTGFARITGGFKLPVSHIIHTVGPVYYSMEHPEHLLSTAYKNCLAVARDNGIKYIAFPAISCGIYGYPFKEAAEVSLNAIGNFADDLKEVHFVLFDQAAWDAWTEEAGKSFEQI